MSRALIFLQRYISSIPIHPAMPEKSKLLFWLLLDIAEQSEARSEMKNWRQKVLNLLFGNLNSNSNEK